MGVGYRSPLVSTRAIPGIFLIHVFLYTDTGLSNIENRNFNTQGERAYTVTQTLKNVTYSPYYHRCQETLAGF
jgi:hypothetical protein